MGERNIDWLPLAHPQLGIWPATQACAPTGNRTGDLLVHRLVLNPLSHTSQSCIFIITFITLNIVEHLLCTKTTC